MNRVSRRASALFLLILLLSGGLGFFVYEYFTKAESWVVSVGSPHIFNSANIGCGQVTDRGGELLLDITSKRTYASDLSLRMSTLHLLGDRQGRISAPAIAHYGREMTGYDLVDGLYSYDGSAGEAILTISASVQKAALEALGDRKGTIGIYNYRTGEILCAVTTPTYDPDNVPDIDGDSTGAYEGVYVNRFVQSSYIPGSIFKIVTTAAALESVPNILDQKFECTGLYEYGIDKVSCEQPHGVLSLKQALLKSCNCCFAQIANLVGAENMQKYADQFQVTEPVKFDGITTVKGNFDMTDAARVEIAWGGIGQYTNQINPCRYMLFMGAIAGGGKAANPYLVAEVFSEGVQTYAAKTTYSDRILSESTVNILKEYMRNNVSSGYGDHHFPGLQVCAKSGTSQLGGDQVSNAMFSGFIDDEKYPLAFIVVVENGGYGSATCVPILSEVLAVCKSVLDAE